jgi:hypothetical protein
MSLQGDGQPPFQNHRLLTSFLKLVPNVNQQYLFIHHHHRYPGLKEMLPHIQECSRRLNQQGDKLYLFTSVREPISHMKSSVNYWNQSHHPSEARTFSTYSPSDPQSKYLLYNSGAWKMTNADSAPQSEIKKVLDFMDGVYATDNFQSLEKDLRKWIGRDFKWDTSRDNVSKKLISPTEEQKKQHLENCKIDSWMYKHAGLLAAKKDKEKNESI